MVTGKSRFARQMVTQTSSTLVKEFCKGYINTLSVDNLPRLRTSNVNGYNKKWLFTNKGSSRRYLTETVMDADDADDTALLANTLTQAVSLLHSLDSFRDRGCCLQDLFNTTRSILAQLPSSFLSILLVRVHIVHPYSSIDSTAARKKMCFILSDRSDFHMTNNLSIAFNAFASRVDVIFRR